MSLVRLESNAWSAAGSRSQTSVNNPDNRFDLSLTITLGSFRPKRPGGWKVNRRDKITSAYALRSYRQGIGQGLVSVSALARPD